MDEQPARVVGKVKDVYFIWEKQITATKYLYGLSKDGVLPPPCNYLQLSTLLSQKGM
jgi:hypothetical protein